MMAEVVLNFLARYILESPGLLFQQDRAALRRNAALKVRQMLHLL